MLLTRLGTSSKDHRYSASFPGCDIKPPLLAFTGVKTSLCERHLDCVSCVTAFSAADQIQDHTGTGGAAGGGNQRSRPLVPQLETLPRKSPSSLLPLRFEACRIPPPPSPPSPLSWILLYVGRSTVGEGWVCSYGSRAFRGHWASSASLHPCVGRDWWGVSCKKWLYGCFVSVCVCVCVILYCVCAFYSALQRWQMWRRMERPQGVDKGDVECAWVYVCVTYNFWRLHSVSPQHECGQS